MSIDRQKIYDKTEGKCYYCGCDLPKRWHKDHFWPQRKSHWLQSKPMMEGVPAPEDLEDIDDARNLVPACPRCNIRKSSFDVEQFREEIAAQVERLMKYSNQFQLALDYGLIEITDKEVQFHFEKMEEE